MKTNKTTWEDIVFEYRNKDYGAYRLRHLYPRNIFIAVTSVVTVALLLFIIPTFFGKTEEEETVEQPKTAKMVYYAELAAPPPIEKAYTPPPQQKTVQQQTVRKVVKYVAPKVTKEEIEVVEDDVPTTEEVNNNAIGTQNVEGTGDVVYDEPIQVEEPQPEPEPEPEPKPEKVVYTTVQKKPEYPGGQAALFQYLRDNIMYPQVSLDNGIQGTVVVQFTVNENGELSDLVVARSLDRSCDEEAIRVIKKMPKWEAGEQNGKKVCVRYTMPIRFVMTNKRR